MKSEKRNGVKTLRNIGEIWKMMLYSSMIFVFHFSLFTSVQAQHGDLLNRTEVMLAGGGMTYLGDLNEQSAFGEVNLAGSFGVRTWLDNRWALRGMVGYGSVSAMHDCFESRNLSFRSNLFEASLVVEFTFRPYGPGATESPWTPYIFGGFGFFHFNPKTKYTSADGTENWAELQPLCTEGQGTSLYPERRPYSLIQMNMPFGVGVRWRVSKSVSLAVEYGFRKTWTDYLDDVSTTYVGSEVLVSQVRDGVLAAMLADRSPVPNAPGIKRGDDSLDDWYSYFNLSIGLNLNTLFGWMRSKKCRN